MAARNQSWYDLNTSRGLPLDDAATLLDDAGNRLPSHIIAGLYLVFPQVAAKYAYVSAVAVTPNVVTVIIAGADTPTGYSVTPLAAISLRKPVAKWQQHNLESQYPGAGGWIVFGEGIDEEAGYSGRFTTAAQSLLSPRIARKMPGLPIPSVGKLDTNTPLTGLVYLVGGSDIEIVKECREIPVAPAAHDPHYCQIEETLAAARDVIVFRLRSKVEGPEENVFAEYIGPCGGRPESQTCPTPAVEYIGPVAPDCCGRITLDFRGCAEVSEIVEATTVGGSTREACGVVLDCSLDLEDACVSPNRLPDDEGRLPNEYDPFCISVSTASESVPLPDEEEEPPFSVSESLSLSEDWPDPFEHIGDWVMRAGQFEKLPSGLFESQSGAMRNVATFEPVPLPRLRYRRATGVIRIRADTGGALHNGALIVNYVKTSPTSGLYKYWVAEIDWDGHYRGYKLFRIGRFTGTQWLTELAVPVPSLNLGERYEIWVEVYPQENDVDAWLIAHLGGLDDPSIDLTIGPMAISDFFSAEEDGLFGLGANRSLSEFLSFKIEVLVP